jgi:hypothetical protein
MKRFLAEECKTTDMTGDIAHAFAALLEMEVGDGVSFKACTNRAGKDLIALQYDLVGCSAYGSCPFHLCIFCLR